VKTNDRLRDLQYRLEYGVLRLVAGFFRALRLNVATGASAYCWRRLAPLINPKRHKRALANLAIAFPEKSEEERLRIALAHWENLGRVMVETMRIDRFLKEPERIDIVSQNIFSRYKDKLGPAVGVSLHMGTGSWPSCPFTWAGANPAAVYRSVTNPYVDQYLRDQRKDLYPGRPLWTRQRRRSWRRPADGARHHGLRAARRPSRPRLRSLRPHRDAGFRSSDAMPRPRRSGAMIARRVGARIWLSRCKRIGTQSRSRSS